MSTSTASKTLLGCVENRAEWECHGRELVRIRKSFGWVLCGHLVYDTLTWEPILVLCTECCEKHGFRW
jgi:hypothetical protein